MHLQRTADQRVVLRPQQRVDFHCSVDVRNCVAPAALFKSLSPVELGAVHAMYEAAAKAACDKVNREADMLRRAISN